MLGKTVGNDLTIAGTSRTKMRAQGLFVRAISRSARIREKIKNAGDITDFLDWQYANFGLAHVRMTREQLWQDMISLLPPQQPLVVFEFGVAWGYSTQWWLDRLPAENVRWHGFDRFTGLPRAWRGLPAGSYGAAGLPPAIEDSRLKWHIGDLPGTLSDISAEDTSFGNRIVLFDLDIFEPTFAAWEFLRESLREGDLIYFDEAMDPDERRVLDEHVLPGGNVEYIGATSCGLALRVTGARR